MKGNKSFTDNLHEGGGNMHSPLLCSQFIMEVIEPNPSTPRNNLEQGEVSGQMEEKHWTT